MVEGLFQPLHLIIILVIALVVFGPGKLANVGGAMGKSIKAFRVNSTDSQPNVHQTTVVAPLAMVGSGMTADLQKKVVASDPANV